MKYHQNTSKSSHYIDFLLKKILVENEKAFGAVVTQRHNNAAQNPEACGCERDGRGFDSLLFT